MRSIGYFCYIYSYFTKNDMYYQEINDVIVIYSKKRLLEWCYPTVFTTWEGFQ